jgi:hypothetical protein
VDKPLSLLVVDVSEDWEEVAKAYERGYFIDWDDIAPGRYVRGNLDVKSILSIQYPHGSVRAGFDAIIDTVRIAHQWGVPIYAVEYSAENTYGEKQTCFSLQPYIQEANRYRKYALSAFSCALADRLKSEGCQHLMIIGYDRDACVMETIRDAVERGITVVTSEHCMLTQNMYNRRTHSLAYFKKHTIFRKTLPDVWNYVRNATTANKRMP